MASSVARGEPICRKEDCSPFDIGTVYKEIAGYSNANKFAFIESIWKPDPLFQFSKSRENDGKDRKFRQEWLLTFPWLAYSKYLDGAFCLPCVCFGRECGKNGAKLERLFRSPLTCWTSAKSRLDKHAGGKCETHRFSVLAMHNFMHSMRRQTVPIDQQLNRLEQAQIKENREKMKSIVKTIILCGQNNIPLRGKRDDSPDNELLQGNFQTLLKFRIDSGDEKLKEHFETAPRNATYRSKTVQTEIIETVGKYIVSKIVEEIRTSKMFSIMADEAADISNKENLSLVLRFVDSARNIREEFVGFRLCGENTSGEAIKDLIINSVTDLGLTMDECRGQSYDGAGNMAGKYVGASTLIQRLFSKAVYVHCMNHRLNLYVAKTCSIQMVQNMMTTVRKLSEFFSNSPKRQHRFESKIPILLPNSNHRTLIDVCRTRWVARLDGFDRVIELFVPILETLRDITLDKNEEGVAGMGVWNAKSKDDAAALLNSITFQFIVTLVVVKYILNLTRPATVKLQREEMDILSAEREISSLKRTLQHFQTNIDEHHDRLYQEAVQLAGKADIEPSQPRAVSRQIYRANNPASNPKDYFRINLTRPFLDHSLSQLQSRFPPEAYLCYKGFSAVPAILLNHRATWQTDVQAFVHHYSQDLPNVAGLSAELYLWERLWEEKKERAEDIPDKIATTLKVIHPDSFPNIFTILQILATVPVTSCSCERSISCLRYLKNYLRSTMGVGRLNGLALMHAHRDIPINLDEIIDLFAALHPRRMRLADILSDDA